MKAYLVSDEYGDGGAVVQFAAHNVVARRQGAIELNCEFDGVSCRRYPAFDQYAGSGVPDSVLVEHGWCFECMHCGQRICSEPVDADGEPIELQPIYLPNRVWCSPSCRDAYEARRREEQERADAAGAAAIAKWPGITVVQTHGYGTPGWVRFKFPGGIGECDWTIGEDSLLVEKRDHDAWHAFASSLSTTDKPRGEQ